MERATPQPAPTRAYGWPRLNMRRPSKGAVATGVEALGLALIALGVGLWALPAGLIVAGIALVIIAQGVGR
ncbi:MAG: hypothetical protein ACTHMU_19325 [Thermomicrobiales bacterium]